jgi:hypothetical protein
LGGSVEHINNGGFDSSDYWSVDGGVTISGGVVNFDDATSGNLTQINSDMNVGLVTNTDYTISFDIVTSNTLYFRIRSSDYSILYDNFSHRATGSYSVDFSTGADLGTNGGISFNIVTTSTASGTIDNISIKLR